MAKRVKWEVGVGRDFYFEPRSAYLLLVGTGFGFMDDSAQELKQCAAAHELADRIDLAGCLRNLCERLRASDMFVFANEYGGIGLSIPKAMAVGLPLVRTRAGVAADLTKRNRPEFLLDPRLPLQFKEALRRLLFDPTWQQANAARGLKSPKSIFDECRSAPSRATDEARHERRTRACGGSPEAARGR
jgi:glycosyltransferase involved in cell wall biosynthesis